MKKPASGAKRGRKPKTTRSMKIELHPKAYHWLEILFAKGRFGNCLEDVPVHLLNGCFKQLLQDGELMEQTAVEGAIPFPAESVQKTEGIHRNTPNMPNAN